MASIAQWRPPFALGAVAASPSPSVARLHSGYVRSHPVPMTPIGRRRFLAALATAGAAPMLGARTFTARRYVGCRVDHEGRYLASVFDESGAILHDVSLPGRGHGFAVHPSTGHLVVFARRPGEWASVVDPATGAEVRRLSATEGRHFYGHGAFRPDGAVLYTSENRFEDGRGIIGVWDVVSGWKRIHEWPSHGVGPHEIRVLRAGTRLAVANGGIRTHPDTGRAKLNLDAMVSSLAVLDTADGGLVRSQSLGERLRRLSIRHLDIDRDFRIVVAMQHEGSRRDRVPWSHSKRMRGWCRRTRHPKSAAGCASTRVRSPSTPPGATSRSHTRTKAS